MWKTIDFFFFPILFIFVAFFQKMTFNATIIISSFLFQFFIFSVLPIYTFLNAPKTHLIVNASIMTLRNTSDLNHNSSCNKYPHNNSINNYLVWVLNKTTKYGKVMSRVKAHYGEHKMLSQILFFKTMCVWTSTKLVLKGVFINCIHNKVVQNPKN
jgi:hypothetical protein